MKTGIENGLRVGLIGANGRWGPRAHVPALKGLPQTELYAVCTAHADTAWAAAEKFGVARAYGDDKVMGADPQVEAALVAVRVPVHYVLTRTSDRTWQRDVTPSITPCAATGCSMPSGARPRRGSGRRSCCRFPRFQAVLTVVLRSHR
jgi:hypothetical protein